MTEIKTPPVKATRVEDIDDASDIPGAYEIRSVEGEECGLSYICPCGCKREGWLPFRPRPQPSWEFDGKADAPTLSPSILWRDHWHGYLRNGIWESC